MTSLTMLASVIRKELVSTVKYYIQTIPIKQYTFVVAYKLYVALMETRNEPTKSAINGMHQKLLALITNIVIGS